MCFTLYIYIYIYIYICTFQQFSQRKEFIHFYDVAEMAIVQRKFNLVSIQMRNESFQNLSIVLWARSLRLIFGVARVYVSFWW